MKTKRRYAMWVLSLEIGEAVLQEAGPCHRQPFLWPHSFAFRGADDVVIIAANCTDLQCNMIVVVSHEGRGVNGWRPEK